MKLWFYDCGDIKAAETKEDLPHCGSSSCWGEIPTVTDKDGQEYRVILLPQYRLNDVVTVPESCYKEFGSDLDSCSRQESQGCQGCRVLREAKIDEA